MRNTREKTSHTGWVRASAPLCLHDRMCDAAMQLGITTPEAYRRALRWALRFGAWGVTLADVEKTCKKKRIDLVLTPALTISLNQAAATMNCLAQTLVIQAASAWVIRTEPPDWIQTAEPYVPEMAEGPKPGIWQVVSGLDAKRTCADLALMTGSSWHATYGQLQTMQRIGVITLEHAGARVFVERA